MPTIGLANTELVARLASLTVNGISYGAAKNWKINGKWGVTKEAVCGSFILRKLHTIYDAEITCDAIFVSNDNWAHLVLDASPDTLITVVATDTDTGAGHGWTSTSTVKVEEFYREGPPNAEGVIKCQLKVTVIGQPTVAFS